MMTNKDFRFVNEGIIIHLFWAITLIIVTAPLTITWMYWRLAKSKSIRDLSKANLSADERTSQLEVMRELDPVSPFNATVSGAGVLLSLLLPIIQAFLSKLVHA
jgi:hypothetical protein